LRAHDIDDSQQALAGLLEITPHVVDLTAFGRDRALAEAELQAIVERLGIVKVPAAGGMFALSLPVWVALKRRLLAALEAFHADNPDLLGIGLERLRLQLEPRFAGACAPFGAPRVSCETRLPWTAPGCDWPATRCA